MTLHVADAVDQIVMPGGLDESSRLRRRISHRLFRESMPAGG